VSRINFFAEGLPKGQPRPKAFSRGGHARVYDPGTAEGWKSAVAVAAKPFLPAIPLIGPVKLELWFQMPRPKAHYRTGKNGGFLRPDAPTLHVGKPDCDNLAKAVLDALTHLRIWHDDAQVWRLTVQKSYDGDRPGCEITITQGLA
jgi:Holliday junction resolvase RusA-like endonuclease